MLWYNYCMSAVSETERLRYRFGKLGQTWSLALSVVNGRLGKEAAARLAQENIKGGRATKNASKGNAAVISSES